MLTEPRRFLQAANYTPSQGRRVDLIVLHSTESPETPKRAWGIAQWFAGKTAPKASAHFIVDDSEVVQCVFEQDIAWAAPGANHNGLHIELVGLAKQAPEDWMDGYSRLVIDQAAKLCADLCRRFEIPAKALGPDKLLTGALGITTHAAVSQAFKKSTHWDPGPGFPLYSFAQRVGEVLSFNTTTEEV